METKVLSIYPVTQGQSGRKGGGGCLVCPIKGPVPKVINNNNNNNKKKGKNKNKNRQTNKNQPWKLT